MGDLFKESPVLGERDIQSSSPVGEDREKTFFPPLGEAGKRLKCPLGRRTEKSRLSPPGRKEGEIHPPPTTRGGQRKRFIPPWGRTEREVFPRGGTGQEQSSPWWEDRKGSLPPWGETQKSVSSGEEDRNL